MPEARQVASVLATYLIRSGLTGEGTMFTQSNIDTALDQGKTVESIVGLSAWLCRLFGMLISCNVYRNEACGKANCCRFPNPPSKTRPKAVNGLRSDRKGSLWIAEVDPILWTTKRPKEMKLFRRLVTLAPRERARRQPFLPPPIGQTNDTTRREGAQFRRVA